jgi:hypothetical protein
MISLLACLAALPGCSDISHVVSPVGKFTPPSSLVAGLAVVSDSSTLTIGHSAQVSGTATDPQGNPVAATVSWTAVTPEIASVSAAGVVTALTSGEAIIEGRVADLSARGKIQVVLPPAAAPAAPPQEGAPADLASNDFDNGSLGPFTNPWLVDLDFPADPTGSGRGKVARFHYKGDIGDQNRAMLFAHKRGFGQPMYFRGEFNIAVDDIAASPVIRKLVYWQSQRDWGKYTKNGGLATGRTVVHLTGSDLIVDATFNPAAGSGRIADDVRTWDIIATGLKGNQWYTLEVFQQMESELGGSDGVLRVWLNGELLFEKTTMTWSDPLWVGDTSNSVPFEASDIYFMGFLVGQQVNRHDSSFDEYRYWDNVAFSTKRIGN